MKRLQLRHHDELFNSRSLALEFFDNILNPGRIENYKFGSSLYAEPMVVKYLDKDGNVQILLAIGTDSINSPYHIIDSADIAEKINTEILRSKDEDEKLRTIIDTEIKRAIDAENTLNNKISNNLMSIVSVEPSNSNVLEEYALKNSNNEILGEHIKIYKDSSLVGFTNGFKGAKSVEIDGDSFKLTYDESLRDENVEFIYLIYRNEDGFLKLLGIDFENFLMESEFGFGIKVVDHVASINIKDGEKYINVDSTGIHSVNIDEAIEYAVNEEKLRAEQVEIELKNNIDLNKVSVFEIKENLPSNIKVRYEIRNNNNEVLGSPIEFPNESSLEKVEQGWVGDIIDVNTGEYISRGNTENSPKNSLNFIYRLKNGNYSLTSIRIADYFSDAHFGKGLNNQDGSVSIVPGDGNEEYLIIGEDTIAVVGINAAIDNAKKILKEYTDNEISKLNIPSLDGYATEDYVKMAIANAQLSGKTDVDLSNYATKEDVSKEIAKVVAGADSNFDTLKEIADYISNDITSAATLTNTVLDIKNNVYYTSGDTEISIKDYIDYLENKVNNLEEKIKNITISQDQVRNIIKEYLSGVDKEIKISEDTEKSKLMIGFADDAIFG